MTTNTSSQAAEAARSFRLATRAREVDPIAYDLALHQHLDQFVLRPGRNRACSMPGH